MAKPTAKSKSVIEEFVDQRFEELAEAQGLVDDGKMQLNVRLPRHSVFLLQEIARSLDMTRPALSASLLDLAISEAAEHLGITLDDQETLERLRAFKGESVVK